MNGYSRTKKFLTTWRKLTSFSLSDFMSKEILASSLFAPAKSRFSTRSIKRIVGTRAATLYLWTKPEAARHANIRCQQRGNDNICPSAIAPRDCGGCGRQSIHSRRFDSLCCKISSRWRKVSWTKIFCFFS